MTLRRGVAVRGSVVLLGSLLVFVFGVAPAGAAALPNPLVPNPTTDPFYTQPASFAGDGPGQVLKSRKVTVPALSLASTTYQVQYVSTDTAGAPQANVATILKPRSPSNSPKLVSYQPAIDSLSYNCDPSYQLRRGTQKEVGVIAALLVKGWTVVVPDFLGPDHEWTAGYVEAKGTLDGIRAAENFAPAGLNGAATPVGMNGYSGGARGTEFANELAPTYAPELNIVGAAPGGLAVNAEHVMRHVNGGVFAGIYLAALLGLDRAYPSMRVDALLNARGKQMQKNISRMCIVQYTATYAFHRIESYTVDGVDPMSLPRVQSVLHQIRGGQYGTPAAPTYLYMASNDELVVPADADKLVQKYCAEGLTVDYVKIPGEHVTTLATGFPGAVTWLAGRFAGKPAPTTCGKV